MNIDELSMNFIYFLYKFSALGSTCLWRTKWIKYPNVSFLLVILVFSIYIFFILGTSECLESSWKSHGPFFQVCYLHFQAGQVEERVDVARMVPQRLEKLVLRVFRIVQQGPEVVVGTRVRRPQPAFEQQQKVRHEGPSAANKQPGFVGYEDDVRRFVKHVWFIGGLGPYHTRKQYLYTAVHLSLN